MRFCYSNNHPVFTGEEVNNSMVYISYHIPVFCSYLARLVERQQEWTIMDRLGNFLHGHHTSNYAESALGIIKDIILNRLVTKGDINFVL